MLGRVRLEAGAVDDGEIGDKAVQRGAFGTAQHVADEQPVPCQLGDHTHIDRMGRIGAADQILNVIVLALHMGEHIGMQRVKAFGRHGRIVFPPDGVDHAVGFDHMFVFGRTSGEFAGAAQECAAFAKGALAVLERGFNQRGLHKIVRDIAQTFDPLIFQSELRVYPSKCHIAKLL